MTAISNRHQWLTLLSLIILCCLIYSNTLDVPFYFDDVGNIEKNPHIRLTKLTFREIATAGFKSPCSNRPIANISFALNYYFDQYDVKGYHAVNVIIHITTGILLYFFLKATLSLPPLRSRYKPHSSIAFFATLIWLVHPIQTQSVTYIVQRMNSMSAMFCMLTLLLYVKGRRVRENQKTRPLPGQAWLWQASCFTGCAFAWILALGCKEIAATLPFFILLYELYFLQDLSRSWLKRSLPYVIGTLILLGIIAFAYMGPNPFKGILSGYACRGFTLTERILTQFRVIIYYISLMLYPHPSHLNLVHDFKLSHSLVDPTSTLISMGAIVGSIGLAFYLARKEPLISFSILWFFGNLMIESSVIGLEIIFEHRTYLPSMFFFVIITILAFRYVKRDFLKAAVLGMAVLLSCLWTYERNRTWNDPATFWNDAIRKSPHNARAYNNLGKFYIEKRAYSMALTNLKQAIRLNPRLLQAHNNLGNIYVHQGLYDLAIEMYRKALDMNPGYHVTYMNLGVALREKGNISAAVDVHLKAIEMMPIDDEAYDFLGSDYLAQHQIDLAIEAFRKALKWNPYSYKSHNNLGLAYAKKGDVRRAIDMYTRAIAIKPDFALAYSNQAALYLDHGGAHKAISFFRKAMRQATKLDPNFADAHNNFGLALINKALFVQGILEFKEALRLQSNHADATFNLGRAYELTGKYEPAIAQYDKSIRLNPKDIEAYHNAGVVCLYHLKHKKRAIYYFKKALSIDPHYPESEEVKRIINEFADQQNED